MKPVLVLAVVLTLSGCGGSPEPQQRAAAPKRETVFEPLVGTIDRANGVQQTVDDQAAERRRQIEAAER